MIYCVTVAWQALLTYFNQNSKTVAFTSTFWEGAQGKAKSTIKARYTINTLKYDFKIELQKDIVARGKIINKAFYEEFTRLLAGLNLGDDWVWRRLWHMRCNQIATNLYIGALRNGTCKIMITCKIDAAMIIMHNYAAMWCCNFLGQIQWTIRSPWCDFTTCACSSTANKQQ